MYLISHPLSILLFLFENFLLFLLHIFSLFSGVSATDDIWCTSSVEPLDWLFPRSIALQAMISHTRHGRSVLVNYSETLSVPRLVTRHSSFITCHSLLLVLHY